MLCISMYITRHSQHRSHAICGLVVIRTVRHEFGTSDATTYTFTQLGHFHDQAMTRAQQSTLTSRLSWNIVVEAIQYHVYIR